MILTLTEWSLQVEITGLKIEATAIGTKDAGCRCSLLFLLYYRKKAALYSHIKSSKPL